MPPTRSCSWTGTAGWPREHTPSVDRVDGDQVREWAFLGWIALADLVKYLERGSLWEAHARPHEARSRIWALWAAAKGARYPVFGLSRVLDRDPNDLPEGIGQSAPDPAVAVDRLWFLPALADW